MMEGSLSNETELQAGGADLERGGDIFGDLDGGRVSISHSVGND
jgi:hypothetical protein